MSIDLNSPINGEGAFDASSIQVYDARLGADQGSVALSPSRLFAGTNIVNIKIPLYGNDNGTKVYSEWLALFRNLNSLAGGDTSLSGLQALISSVKLYINDVEMSHSLVDISAETSGTAYLEYTIQVFPLWNLDSIDSSNTSTNNIALSKGYSFKLEINFTTDHGKQASYAEILSAPLNINTVRVRKKAPERSANMELIRQHFPGYTKAHIDRASKAQQVLSPLGLELDSLRTSALREMQSNSPISAKVDEAAWLYRYELRTESEEQFQSGLDSKGYRTYYPPQSIVGQIGYNQVELYYAETPRELISSLPPTRITLEKIAENIRPYLTGSTPIERLHEIPEITLEVPSRIYLKVHSSSNLIKLDKDEGTLEVTSIKLKGTLVGGVEFEEKILLSEERTYMTRKIWKHFTVELCSAPNDVSAEVFFLAMPVEGSVVAENFVFTLSDDNTLAFYIWELEDSPLSADMQGALTPNPTIYKTRRGGHASVLVKRTAKQEPDLDILQGLDSTFVEKKFFLLDVNSGIPAATAGAKTLISGISLSGRPEENDLYLIDQTHLYTFPKRDGAPGILEIDSDGKNIPFLSLAKEASVLSEISFVLEEFDDPFLTFEDGTIKLNYTVHVGIDLARDSDVIARWSWSYYEPDGTQIFLDKDKAKSPVQIWPENSLPIHYFGIEDRDYDLTLTIALDDLARLIDPVHKNIRHHFLIKLDILLTTGDTQAVFQVLEFPIKQATSSFRFASVWADEDHDIQAVTGTDQLTVKPETFRLQPRVLHGDPDAENLSFNISGAYKDATLAFDILGDNSLSLHIANSQSYSPYTGGALPAPPFSSLYRVIFHRDYYTCDFERSELLMTEKYDSVLIQTGELNGVGG